MPCEAVGHPCTLKATVVQCAYLTLQTLYEETYHSHFPVFYRWIFSLLWLSRIHNIDVMDLELLLLATT